MARKRFVVAYRHSPKMSPEAETGLREFVESDNQAALVRRTSVGRWVVEMTEDEMRDLVRRDPDLLIEEDEELELFGMPGLPERVPSDGQFTLSVAVRDADTGEAVPNVTIYGIGQGVAYKALTNEEGRAELRVYETNLERVIASPRDTYWSKVVPDVNVQDSPALDVTLGRLLVTGSYDWGHRLMGFRLLQRRYAAKGVRIGVIDSGVSDQHPDLAPAGGHNALDGSPPDHWNVDEKGHGTHVSGVVSALNNDIGVLGGAPEAEIFSIKVFPGGRRSDLVEAVEWCIRNRMDVISMSLGGPTPSRILAQVLKDAQDRGITSIAAVGNQAREVAYPAALPSVIGVGAIGRFGTFPEDSGHALKVGPHRDWRGGLFSASFTNRGPEVDYCAPGVAVLSTVPSGYAAWDGTSMACPIVSALVALVLEAYPMIRTGDAQQPELVRYVLDFAAADLGMPPEIQGQGLPLAPRALPPLR